MKRLWIAAFAVVVLVNAAVFAGVGYNRSALSQAPVWLSADNFGLPRFSESTFGEHFGLQLNLGLARSDRQWLSDKQRQALGWQAGVDRQNVPAWIVFELDGPQRKAYELALRQQLQQAEQALEHETEQEHWLEQVERIRQQLSGLAGANNLWPIDAGPAPEPLLARYGKDGKHLILPGRLYGFSEGLPSHISLDNSNVYLTAEQHRLLQRAGSQLKLAVGLRYELWVLEVSAP